MNVCCFIGHARLQATDPDVSWHRTFPSYADTLFTWDLGRIVSPRTENNDGNFEQERDRHASAVQQGGSKDVGTKMGARGNEYQGLLPFSVAAPPCAGEAENDASAPRARPPPG